MRIVEFALTNRLPLMSEGREFTEAGGLMTYGPKMNDLYRRAAAYADQILRGAKPAEALRLTIPQTLLLRADQVIE